MSGAMFRALKMLIVVVSLSALWAVPGLAFQLFGVDTSQKSAAVNTPNNTIESGSRLSADSPLNLGDSDGVVPADEDGLNIWIPGIGVVGQMPKLNFGLEMLYGAQETDKDAPNAAHELEEFESDFAIKGTIKRKF